jgi:hypothetical protein
VRLQFENRMPLRVTAGVPIRPSRRRPALAGDGLGLAAAAGTPPVLPVPYVKQTQNQWCWAACAEMVARYLGNTTVTQCELANFLHGQTKCCTFPGSTDCNRPTPYEGVGQVYRHLGINCISHRWPVNAQVVLRELTARRPIEVGYLWVGGGGHVAVIYGVGPDGRLAVHDPWPDFGSGFATYQFVLTAYGMGRWAFSYGALRRLTP